MGDVLKFPTPENQVQEELEALVEAARAGALTAFVYIYQDQEGEYTYSWAGEVDVEETRIQLMDLRRALKASE